MVDWRVGLSERVRAVVVAVTTLMILVFVNLQIAGKETIVRDGTTVLLRLAPQDPRSLLQGDYMALRYALTAAVAEAARAAGVSDGRIVLALGGDDGAELVGLYHEQPLGPHQQLLIFRKRGDSVRLASDAFFFEEGQGERFANARYGELRVADDGEAVLIGLRDADGNRISATESSVD